MHLNLEAAAAATVILTGVLSLLYFAWRHAVRPAWRALNAMLADWHGVPARPGVPARQGVMERLAAIEALRGRVAEGLEAVTAELKPNGGSSMRDAVDRVESRLGVNEDAATYRKDHT